MYTLDECTDGRGLERQGEKQRRTSRQHRPDLFLHAASNTRTPVTWQARWGNKPVHLKRDAFAGCHLETLHARRMRTPTRAPHQNNTTIVCMMPSLSEWRAPYTLSTWTSHNQSCFWRWRATHPVQDALKLRFVVLSGSGKVSSLANADSSSVHLCIQKVALVGSVRTWHRKHVLHTTKITGGLSPHAKRR